MADSERKWLRHSVPHWVDLNQAVFSITICCQQRGVNQLCHPNVADKLLETVENRLDRQLWYPYVFLLMPDHLHALISFPPHGKGMTTTIREWKGWTAKQLGLRWQRGFFDHRLRNDENHRDKANYILHNPVRAGLVSRSEDWPYTWFPR